MTNIATSEIDDYVAAVHAALADLTVAERDDLLDDLPQHLADVQADRAGTLTELLGEPGAYAAELRATAGLASGPPAGTWWQSTRCRLTSADRRVGSVLGYERFVDLLRALAPAWWLVRAWLLVELGTGATGRSGAEVLLPEVDGNPIVGVALLLLVAVGSVWLGRRGLAQNWQRVVAVLIGLALAGYGVSLVRQATTGASVTYVSDDSGDGYDTSGVTNVYPVGPDGTVLNNVRLYDQDGNPIPLGTACDGTSNADDATEGGTSDGTQSGDGALTYPLTCADQGPFPSGRASALPSSSAPAGSATPTTVPTATTTPRPVPTPTR